MIECLELVCPAGHCLALLFFKPEAIPAEQAALSFAGLAVTGQFSDICTTCGQRAKEAVQRKQSTGLIQEWADIPGLQVPPETTAVIVVRESNGNARIGQLNIRFTPPHALTRPQLAGHVARYVAHGMSKRPPAVFSSQRQKFSRKAQQTPVDIG